jgi:hypothetical protein
MSETRPDIVFRPTHRGSMARMSDPADVPRASVPPHADAAVPLGARRSCNRTKSCRIPCHKGRTSTVDKEHRG